MLYMIWNQEPYSNLVGGQFNNFLISQNCMVTIRYTVAISIRPVLMVIAAPKLNIIQLLLYSASQIKRNRELSMFYHKLITMINDTYLESLDPLLSFDATHNNAYFTHEWLKLIWREETKKSFGGRYLNFKEEITFVRKLGFCPFIWHLNQEKWARNNKVLFV